MDDSKSAGTAGLLKFMVVWTILKNILCRNEVVVADWKLKSAWLEKDLIS